MYNKNELLNLIFSKFRQQVDNPAAGYWWDFKNYLHFVQSHQITMEQFDMLMQELCNDGVFTIVYEAKNMPPTFELTEKGEKLLWNN